MGLPVSSRTIPLSVIVRCCAEIVKLHGDNGERNNIPVAVKTGDEIKPCGAIHLTEEILKEFEEIAGKQNVGIDLY